MDSSLALNDTRHLFTNRRDLTARFGYLALSPSD